jgi:hypothetical protein
MQSLQHTRHEVAVATTTETATKVEKHAIYRKSQATNWRQLRKEFESIRVFTGLSLGFVAEHLCPLAIIALLLRIWQNCLQCLHNVYQSVPNIKGGGRRGGQEEDDCSKEKNGRGRSCFCSVFVVGFVCD